MRFDRNHRIATLAVGSLLALGVTAAQAAIPASERAVLVALYNSTGGGNWTNSSGWNGAPGTECNWYGVTCDPGETTVEEIKLDFNNLAGALPGNLNSLTGLSNFYVPYNDLTGSIPALAGLTNLESFIVSNNGLTGPIPALSGVTTLQDFQANDNRLAGSIPTLTGLPNLQFFHVNRNELTGSIPALTGLTTLQDFQANDNRLAGSIPALTGLTNLRDFLVSANRLTGSIPALGTLANLKYVWAHDNRLTGSIPSLAGLTNLLDSHPRGDGRRSPGSDPIRRSDFAARRGPRPYGRRRHAARRHDDGARLALLARPVESARPDARAMVHGRVLLMPVGLSKLLRARSASAQSRHAAPALQRESPAGAVRGFMFMGG